MICIRHYPYARGGVQNNNNNIVRVYENCGVDKPIS